MKLTDEEICILISDARDSFVQVYGQYIANEYRVSNSVHIFVIAKQNFHITIL